MGQKVNKMIEFGCCPIYAHGSYFLPNAAIIIIIMMMISGGNYNYNCTSEIEIVIGLKIIILKSNRIGIL